MPELEFDTTIELCQRCDAEKADEPHTCPYKVEIFDDYDYTCNCCKSCRQECADSV